MTQKRIGVYGAHDESLRLSRQLGESPDIVLVRYYDSDPDGALERARNLGPEFAASFESRFTPDFDAFLGRGDLDAVIDDGHLEPFARRAPLVHERGTQIVSPLTARLLWGYGDAARDRKAELLQALGEVVESVELTIDSAELFARMLEIAVGVTGAEGGSLMLLDNASNALHIKVAIGVEPELWPKINVKLGQGIAGYVAATARPLLVSGKADRRSFQILRERLDVESALCVPLVQDGQVLGVLNLHHSTRRDAFDSSDSEFMEQLAALDAQIIHRAQQHEAMRNQAARYEAVREVYGMIAGPAPLTQRLTQVCKGVAKRLSGGIANIYLRDPEHGREALSLAATSLQGGGFGGEYRLLEGQGVDGRAAQSGRPIFLSSEAGELAYAALPLLAGNTLEGVLSAQAGAGVPASRATQEGLLEIAAAVAEGVGRARREARIQTRATRVNAINETGIRMLSATDVEEVARLATSSLALILDAEHAILRLQDPDTKRYVIASYYGSADDALQTRLFRLDKTVSVEAIRRRTAFLFRDLETQPLTAEHAADFQSLIAAPLKREGQVIGTLAIYDKMAIDRFFPEHFNDEDLHIFSKLVSYVERSIANARVHAAASVHANFDADSGLPNAAYLKMRVHEEIVRAENRENALAVAVCTIENWGELAEKADPAHAHRVMLATANALRSEIRDFDVLSRIGPNQFAVLLPEPGADVRARVFDLSRAVSERICQDDAVNQPVRVALAFGHAAHPAAGDDSDTLIANAREPRIRMV